MLAACNGLATGLDERAATGSASSWPGGAFEDREMFQAHIAPTTPIERLVDAVAARSISAGEVYRGLERRGLSRVQAGNLTARVHGLAPVATGWRVAEIERLLFLRWRAEHGHIPR